MFITLLVSLLAATGSAAPGLAQHETLQLKSATPSATQVPRYGQFSLRLDLKATFDNPFDPDDIDVYAQFTPPDGAPVRVNGFYTVACARSLDKGTEHIKATGQPFWEIRFTPNRVGTWRYRVFAKDRTGNVSLPEAEFKVTPSRAGGFVRRDRGHVRMFRLDSGQPFFAIGENMCWGQRGGTYDYDQWIPRLAKAGGNWIRLWMCRWNCGLEWTPDKKGPHWPDGYAGLGVYNLSNAWKLDRILDLARQYHVRVMLCLGTYGELMTGGYFHEGMWASNPYNAANGGPCAKPEDFWTNKQARKLYKMRLRYIAARYGSRPEIFGWELWNEAHAPAAWVKDIASFLKGMGPYKGAPADPYDHLVSTTYGDDKVWALPEIDFTQTHHYGEGNEPDVAPVVHEDALRFARFGKPHLMAEFGIDWRSSDDKYDPKYTGINMHNGLWASALSGNAGGAMIWYWDNYVDPGHLYREFTALRAFTRGIPWQAGPWQALKADPPTCDTGHETWRDLTVQTNGHWGRSKAKAFTITPRGAVRPDRLPAYLYGSLKPDLREPLVMHVSYAKPGRFELKVSEVSSLVHIRFLVDGTLVHELTLSAAPPKNQHTAPAYESTKFRPQWGSYQATFNKTYGIDVPAGVHTVTVEVDKGDWLSVAKYTFKGYISSRYPPMHLYGITNGTQAYLWVQNAEHNWFNERAGVPIKPIEGAKTVLHGLPAGRYRCEWRNTLSDAQVHVDEVDAPADALPLTIPKLASDYAVAIRPVPPS